ncbi:quinone-dependent dihydroorotate dehydrogenase [Siccirubricoccus sp. KC 17139]|uniref:Dihydroorotate dehydrogenase (quinone) n=1 Tax=Siccirubricoccus soli TaxID=2899147 RepID=A0ABT1DD00_9PROT|nr:quinone-dependent dihydroorotate dehydrogenase [Siccirubricoccus soli]MCO6419095.1 quinone-dependent dihydroorotate dehydrogenase [Siccirubricoccus soli]MCP2685230.1 quinone-dependent dihydroorotate dehydrogenase [Siccirubricoccus soli]
MTPTLASALMPLLRGLDPETAHDLALKALGLGLAGRDGTPDDPVLATHAFGLAFRNPIGLAAGFDKNAVAVLPLMRLGFGFVETGTVTPRPQQGNPRPRLFRLEEDRAIINRMGFNNAGLEVYRARLAALRRPLPAVLGGNIGVNKEGAVPERDYPALYAALAPVTDYVVVNISSPNTPGLRDLQGEERLIAILDAIAAVRQPDHPPLLVKIAPDLADDAVAAVVEACAARNVAGLIVSNTTIARPASLRSRHKGEAGGLSGAPLLARATEVLRLASRLSRGRLTLIGVGGVASGADAYAKIRAGAALVQLYAGFAYAGPALIPRLKSELAALLKRDGFSSVADAVGVDAARDDRPQAA